MALAGAPELGALDPSHDCGFCHGTHTAPGTSLTQEVDSEVLCLSCHGPAGPASKRAEVHANAPAGSEFAPFRFTCVACHAPHDGLPNWLGAHTHGDASTGGRNISLVGAALDGSGLARVDVPGKGPTDVVFEGRGEEEGKRTLHSFADDDEDGNGVRDGICEACHTQTKYATSTGRKPHHRGSTCTTCHPHKKGFVQE